MQIKGRTIDARMSYRQAPNCLPTGDAQPGAKDLFPWGWDIGYEL